MVSTLSPAIMGGDLAQIDHSFTVTAGATDEIQYFVFDTENTDYDGDGTIETTPFKLKEILAYLLFIETTADITVDAVYFDSSYYPYIVSALSAEVTGGIGFQIEAAPGDNAKGMSDYFGGQLPILRRRFGIRATDGAAAGGTVRAVLGTIRMRREF